MITGMAGRFGGGLRSASHSWPGAAMNPRWLSIVAGGALLGTALAQNGSAAHRRHHLRCRLDASRRSSSLPTAAISAAPPVEPFDQTPIPPLRPLATPRTADRRLRQCRRQRRRRVEPRRVRPVRPPAAAAAGTAHGVRRCYAAQGPRRRRWVVGAKIELLHLLVARQRAAVGSSRRLRRPG